MSNKRKDNKGRVLHNGEYQQSNGRYRFKYYDGTGKERYLYSWRLGLVLKIKVAQSDVIM